MGAKDLLGAWAQWAAKECKDLLGAWAQWAAKECKDLLGVLAQWAAKGRKVLPDRRVSSWSCSPALRKACLGVKDLLEVKDPWAAKDLSLIHI